MHVQLMRCQWEDLNMQERSVSQKCFSKEKWFQMGVRVVSENAPSAQGETLCL